MTTATTVPPMSADRLDRLAAATPLARWLAHAAWAYTHAKGDPYFDRNELYAMAALRALYLDDPAAAGVLLAELAELADLDELDSPGK